MRAKLSSRSVFCAVTSCAAVREYLRQRTIAAGSWAGQRRRRASRAAHSAGRVLAAHCSR